MDYFKSKINLYIEKNKKSKKLNQTEIGEVVILLKTALSEDNSVVDEVINILGELHYAVTIEFFKKSFTVLDEPAKTNFLTRYLLSDKIVKSSNFSLTRNLAIVNELLQTTGNDDFIHMILKFCTKKAYDKDAGQKAGELLSKICFASTKEKLFSLDYSTWKETEIQDFLTWVSKAMTVNTDERVSAAYKAWLDKYNSSMGKEVELVVNSSVPESVNNATRPILEAEADKAIPIPKKDQREKIHILVSDLQSEVSKIINERLKLTKIIEEIRAELEQAIKDKEGLLLQLSEARTRNDQLHDEIRIKERQIINGETKYKEIDDRLKNAFKADKSQKNQELTSLKNDIAKRLKLEYQDYKTLASKEPDTQYYEALVGVLESIFDTLRRKGIIINNEIEE